MHRSNLIPVAIKRMRIQVSNHTVSRPSCMPDSPGTAQFLRKNTHQLRKFPCLFIQIEFRLAALNFSNNNSARIITAVLKLFKTIYQIRNGIFFSDITDNSAHRNPRKNRNKLFLNHYIKFIRVGEVSPSAQPPGFRKAQFRPSSPAPSNRALPRNAPAN